MDVAAKKFTKLGGRTITRATACGRCTADGEIYFVSDRTAEREGHQVRRPGSDEERQQHLEDLRQGRRAGAGHAPSATATCSSPASRPTARRSSTRTTSGCGSSTSPAARAPRSSSTSSRTRRRTRRSWSRSTRGGGLPPLALEPARGHRGARRDLHHRHRSRRAAARHARRRGASRIRAGRRTASGSRSSPTAPAARKSGSPTSSARSRRRSATWIATRAAIVWAPDSKSLLWTRLRPQAAPRGGGERQDRSGGARATRATSATPQFSPDGKWISYSKQDNLLRPHVWVKELATGQEHMIASDQFQISQRRQVDAGRQEAAADRRRGSAGDGVAGLPRHAQPALRDLADPHREGSGRSRHQYRRAGAGGAERSARDAAGAVRRCGAAAERGGEDRVGRHRPAHHEADQHAGLGDRR